MAKKYRESKKRRENRRKLSKRYYSLCVRDLESFRDFFWIENVENKSKSLIINCLCRLLLDANMQQVMNSRYQIVINTFLFTKNRGVAKIESMSVYEEKTIREHIEHYIIEQRCMVRSVLPRDLVRMLYTFL